MAERGPRYPTMALQEAISRAKEIYAREHMSPLTAAVAAEGMGYKGISGTSLRAIASLRQYGLLEGRGDEVRLSKDAQTLIIDDATSDEYQSALRRVILNPPMFSELYNQFPNMGSARNIAIYLQKRGFKPDAAAITAKNFKDALALVNSGPGEYIADEADAPSEDKMDQGVQSFASEPRRVPVRASVESPASHSSAPLRVVMNGDRLDIQASVDLAGLKKLQAMLEKYQSILEMMQPEGKEAAN